MSILEIYTGILFFLIGFTLASVLIKLYFDCKLVSKLRREQIMLIS